MNIPQPIIPKEHGAWAVLFVPMLVAGSITGKFSLDLLLLACSALGVFMSYVPVHVILRNTFVGKQPAEKLHQAWFWAVVYLLVGAAFMVPLLFQGFWLLLAIGGVGMVSFLINF
ncbi:MAG: YwiC-like family protein, partial [Bacteroidota bacterium]